VKLYPPYLSLDVPSHHFSEEVLKGPPLAKGKRDSKGRGKLKTSTPMKPLESKEDIDDSRTKVHACDAWREGGRKRMR
jgi:hypothetical protein